MTYAIDFDGILYKNNELDRKVCKRIEELRAEGNKVVLFTSRQSKAFDEAKELLNGIEFDDLVSGKYFADYYIDDRNMSIDDFMQASAKRSNVKKHNDEIRCFKISVPDIETRAESDGEMILEGYASVFEHPTTLFTFDDGTEFKEVISREAFEGVNTDGCFLKFNHDNSVLPLARVRGGSMTLETDDYGLKFRAKLFDTSYSRDVYKIVKAGGIDECSFAFTIDKDGAEYDKKTKTRRINKISHLWDCAIVENPAYNGTSVFARSFFEAEAEKDNLEKLAEERKAKLREEITNILKGENKDEHQ